MQYLIMWLPFLCVRVPRWFHDTGFADSIREQTGIGELEVEHALPSHATSLLSRRGAPPGFRSRASRHFYAIGADNLRGAHFRVPGRSSPPCTSPQTCVNLSSPKNNPSAYRRLNQKKRAIHSDGSIQVGMVEQVACISLGQTALQKMLLRDLLCWSSMLGMEIGLKGTGCGPQKVDGLHGRFRLERIKQTFWKARCVLMFGRGWYRAARRPKQYRNPCRGKISQDPRVLIWTSW
jgi:hypothetical protein